MSVTNDYLKLYNTYSSKYQKVSLLYQIGSFYEIYSSLSPCQGNADVLARLLHIELVTRKDNNILLAGFPVVSLSKYLPILVDNNYTVIVVEQDVKSGNNKVNRFISQVVSKGTSVELSNTRVYNNIMCIYYRKYSRNFYTFGIAVIDLFISKCIQVADVSSEVHDKNLALDTLTQMILYYNPIECIIVTQCNETPNIEQLGFNAQCEIHMKDVQELTKHKIINCNGQSDSIEYAVRGLESYLYDHLIVYNDFTLSYSTTRDYMELTSTTALQLDIPLLFDNPKFNTTLTAMGRRLLYNRLYHPLLDATELNSQYETIASTSNNTVNAIKKRLSGIPDLDKLHQRMSTGRLSVKLFKLLTTIYDSDDICRSTIKQYYSDIVTIDDKTNITFQLGYNTEWDALYNELTEYTNVIDNMKLCMQRQLSIKTMDIELKDELGFITTLKRAKELQKAYNWEINTTYKSCVIVYTPELQEVLRKKKYATVEYNKLTNTLFSELQIQLYNTHKTTLDDFSRRIAELDILQASCVMKEQLNLVRPIILPTTNNSSIINACGVRNLVVENINATQKYIPNDCNLVGNGILGYVLYGINSCGKTCYLKSIGAMIIMAQAGLYVPATKLEYTIMSRIMTRIAGGDNISKSQSSYILELDEISSILRRSDSSTLVLGDEMCRGTDVHSANATVYTILQTLIRRNTLFISATHLHDLVDSIQKLNTSVKIMHMTVTFSDDGYPIYTRRLVDGAGPDTYGLEIAKAMNFSTEFIREAMEYRNNTIGRHNGKLSAYNNRKVTVQCELCEYRPKGAHAVPLDTHHLNYDDGNSLYNLVTLCKKCHQYIHNTSTELIRHHSLSGATTLSVNGI